MAVIFAHFQSSGNSPVLFEVSKILAKGVHSDRLTSFSTRGCIPSGPGDFEIFNLSRFFLTFSFIIIMVSKGGTSTFSLSGIFPSPSIVNTDVKKSASTLAFSLSELVDSVLLMSLNKSGILLFVFVLDLAYFQNLLGFV
jgi:hypothetical protein